MALVSGVLKGNKSLLSVWSMINNLGLTIHFVLLSVENVPGNAFAFQSFMMEMNTGKMIE
jgi:hypothetical protein